MIHPKVFPISDVDEAIIASPAVGVDDALQGHFSTNDSLKSVFGAIWNDLGIDSSVSFKMTENDSLSESSTAPFSLDPSSAASSRIFSSFRFQGKLSSVMVRSKCLPTWYRSRIFPTRRPILSCPRSGFRTSCVASRIFFRSFSVAKRSFFPLCRPTVRQQGIAADDQPLSRKVGRRDLRQVFLVEERGLDLALIPKPGDRWRPNRGDPVEALDLADFLDLNLRQDPPVRHQDHTHPRFLDLAAHYGFEPKACQPYRARTKGKDERMVG